MVLLWNRSRRPVRPLRSSSGQPARCPGAARLCSTKPTMARKAGLLRGWHSRPTPPSTSRRAAAGKETGDWPQPMLLCQCNANAAERRLPAKRRSGCRLELCCKRGLHQVPRAKSRAREVGGRHESVVTGADDYNIAAFRSHCAPRMYTVSASFDSHWNERAARGEPGSSVLFKPHADVCAPDVVV